MTLIRKGSIVILIVAMLFTSFGCVPLSEEESSQVRAKAHTAHTQVRAKAHALLDKKAGGL